MTDQAHLEVHRWPGTGATLACLHGFTLTGASFTEFAAVLPHPVVAPDLPGHGATTLLPIDMDTVVGAVADLVAAEGIRLLLGYSQGGRIALHLALSRPELVDALVVVSAGPGLGEPDRTMRRRADADLADRIEEIGVDRFLDEWLSQPLVGTGHLDPERAARDRGLRATSSKEGLAAALRVLGQGAVAAVDPARLAIPSLWIAGERDGRYAQRTADAAARSGGEHGLIAGAGHNVVLDAPAELARTVDEFLSRLR